MSENEYDEMTPEEQEEKIQKLRNAPITKDIVGEWTLVSTNNTDAYLEKRKRGDFMDIVFLSANQKFEIDGRDMTQIQSIGNEILLEYNAVLGSTVYKPSYKFNSTVEENGMMLRTKHVYYTEDGKMYDVEERRVRNGILYIQNHINHWSNDQWDTVYCTRIYKKFNGESDENIQEEINGEWIPVAFDGFKEFCESTKIDENLWINGHLSFKILNIFNEIHMNHYIEIQISNKTVTVIGNDSNEINTYFQDNALITVENGIESTEIIRFLKNGLLFVSFYQDGNSFMAVYQKS